MFRAHFANNQVVPWNGEKRKHYVLGSPVPCHNSVCIPRNLPKSLSFVASTAVGEDAGGDEHAEQFWCRDLRCLVPMMLQKAEELSRALGSPGYARLGGPWWQDATLQSLLSLHSAQLMLQSFIVIKCSFPAPFPPDLTSESFATCLEKKYLAIVSP